jgi:hypothetical protein
MCVYNYIVETEIDDLGTLRLGTRNETIFTFTIDPTYLEENKPLLEWTLAHMLFKDFEIDFKGLGFLSALLHSELVSIDDCKYASWESSSPHDIDVYSSKIIMEDQSMEEVLNYFNDMIE